ncbi:hypothetical protein Syun_020112 [Stephania yunnanensis]|uniref:Uncharacterized protein n=1 Tax=Stephania yunnanensis TaxID=152371 RepID=A0AAP0IDL1_9MAGN
MEEQNPLHSAALRIAFYIHISAIVGVGPPPPSPLPHPRHPPHLLRPPPLPLHTPRPTPPRRHPLHRLTSLHSSALLFLFFLLSLSLLLPLPFPPNFFFASASALFFLLSSASSASASLQTSHLQAACSSISSRVSALSSLLSFILACNPKLFIIDLALAASLSLQGLWVLQTGLSLYVDAFIPEGCHRLLDVTSGVEGSTRCDLDDSSFRAAAILDLAFLFHVMFLMLIVALTYALLAAKTTTRFGISSSSSSSSSPAVAAAYHPLSTTNNHVQMKTLAGTQA